MSEQPLIIRVGDYVYKFAVMQFLFFLHTVMGVVMLGFFPALMSCVNLLYQWMFFGKDDLVLVKAYRDFYNKYFWESNRLGLVVVLIGLVLYVDYQVSVAYIGSAFIHGIILFLIGVFVVTMCYLPVVFVRYNLKLLQYLWQSLMLAVSSPFQTIAQVICLLILYYVLVSVPFVTMFFGVPLLLLPIVWFSSQGIRSVEEKMGQEKEDESKPSSNE